MHVVRPARTLARSSGKHYTAGGRAAIERRQLYVAHEGVCLTAGLMMSQASLLKQRNLLHAGWKLDVCPSRVGP